MFEPESIAVIGASETPGKVGYAIMQNLKDFKGLVLPVNVKGKYKVLDRFVDLVIIAIPSKFVLVEIERIGRLGIKNVVIISAGFKEVGNVKLENDLKYLVKKYHINMVGPNVFGIASPGMNGTFGVVPEETSTISLFSQSGAVIASINDMAIKKGIGFNKMLSLGNKATLDENDLLEYLKDDESTKVIIGYLEAITDGPKFIELASEITKTKPIVLIKAGRSAQGASAAASHTGSIAGSDNAYETALNKAGVIRVKSVNDLLLYAKVLATQPLPTGNKLGIITNGGGAGIMTTDDAIDAGFELAELDLITKNVLKRSLMEDASVKNPVDILGAGTPHHYSTSTILLNDDPYVDGIIILSCPQTVIPVEDIKSSIEMVETNKPVITSFEYEGEEVKAIKALLEYAAIKFRTTRNITYDLRIEKYELPDREVLGVESFDLLHAYGIPVIRDYTLDDDIKYPVVAKVVDEKVSHKSDAGGVKLNIQNEEELRNAIQELLLIGDDVQIQPMISGKEIIIGMVRDPTFGPMIMVGLGGIYVELLKDVKFGIGKLTYTEAKNMVEGLKTYKLLTGIRGEKSVDIRSIIDILIRVSRLAMDYPELKEFEINPLMVSESGAVAVDMRAMR